MGFLSLFAVVQNKEKPLKAIAQEILIVLSLTTPGVDVWRVASESEQKENELTEQRSILAMTKTAELTAEAIPGAVIQLSAIMAARGSQSKKATLSFALCVFTAASTSSTLSYDFDTGANKRQKQPWFYGYVSDKARGKLQVFLALFFLAAFNLTTWSLSCVLLEIQGGITLATGFLLIELLLYFLYKAIRKDLWYWVPLYGCPGAFMSFMARLMSKVVGDWTAVVQFRSPQKIGGAYLSFGLGLTTALGLNSAFQYEKKGGDDSEGEWEKSAVVAIMARVPAPVWSSPSFCF